MEEITLNKIANILCVCSRNKNKSLPAIFEINNKEVYITQWISNFLDPELNNGWYGMLNALLEYGKNTDPIDLLSAKDNITVHPEYVFKNGRRIDILVIAGKYIIAIENKLWSEEQFNQTADYRKSLKQEYPNKELVCLYLKPEYNKSNSNETYFKTITYGQLHNLLGNTELPSDERTSWLLKEFKDYIIKENLMESYPVCSNRAKKYKEFRDIIEPSRDEYEDYLNCIDTWLKNTERFKKSGFDVSGLHPGYWQIVKDQKWRDLDFHIEVFPIENSEYVQRFGFADQLEIVIHLEKQNDITIINKFESIDKPITKSKNNTYTLTNKIIECNFSSEEEANKTIQRMLDVIESKELQAFYEIADEIIKGQSPNS